MANQTDFSHVARAIAALNAVRIKPLAFGGMGIRYLHWGVTPPDYWRSKRHPNPCGRHKHPYFEVCHAFTGRGAFKAYNPDVSCDITAGDTFFARPGLEHEYGSARGEELGICFWSFVIEANGRTRTREAQSQRHSRQALIEFNASQQTFIRGDTRTTQLLALLFDEALAGADSGRMSLLLAYLLQHLAGAAVGGVTEPERERTASSWDGSRLQTAGQMLWRAQQYVQDHCHRDLRIEELAERTGYSRRHLARMFRARAGVSFSEYLARVRLQTACHLLLDESQPLKRVAQKTGFGSLAAFTRAFKRGMGVTPGEYRARSVGAAR